MSGITILVIDDEPSIVDILEKFLAMQGFGVKKAYDGKEGLKVIKRGKDKVDLIILDEKMPGMGGSAFMKELRINGPRIPVVVLTGSINVSQIDPEEKKAYKPLLIKPVRLSELLKIIYKLLDKPSGKRGSVRKRKKA